MRRKKQLSLEDLDRTLNLIRLESLDAVIQIGDEQTTLGETLGDDKEARFQRLKNFLDSVATSKREKNILELMYFGFSRDEIREQLKITSENLRKTLERFRRKCRQHGLNINNKKK